MGKIKKKLISGAATNYISRTQALKKLQLSLKDFRRLCILKGIYPHEPKHKKKVNKGSSENKTFYFVKDIYFLQNEPIIEKLRDHKIFLRRLKRALAKKDKDAAQRISENKPVYKLDHIVKERYPTFLEALRDLDDVICMCALFARLPKSPIVKCELIQLCRRLMAEFMNYVIETKALRKVFISIKGIYYQVEVCGETVTWIVSHDRAHHPVTEIDFTVLSTFIEFYVCLLGFVNFKLFSSIGLHYPPTIMSDQTSTDSDGMNDEYTSELVASLNQSLARSVDFDKNSIVEIDSFEIEAPNEHIAKLKNDQQAVIRLQNLFGELKFFLSREVPHESLTFIIRSCGGHVSWDSILWPGATFSENDSQITHQIVDRATVTMQNIARRYVQPQWVYDCVNARKLLPINKYLPGSILPPHLSPFVEQDEFAVLEKEILNEISNNEVKKKKKVTITDPSTVSINDIVNEGKNDIVPKVLEGKIKKTHPQVLIDQEGAERKLQEAMVAKRFKLAYKKMKYAEKKKRNQSKKMVEKRVRIEREKVFDP